MKKIILLILLAAATTRADFKITALITVTNSPITNGSSFTWNGDTRTSTNAMTSTRFIGTNTSIASTTTNFYRQIITYPFSGAQRVEWISTNSLKIWANNNVLVTNTFVGSWGTSVLSTQTIGAVATVITVPASNWNNQVSASNSFNQLVDGLNGWTTRFINKTTNGVNYGSAFSSPGTNSGSQQFGGAEATGQYSLSVGEASTSRGFATTAIGYSAQSVASGATSLGNNAYAVETNSTAIGAGAVVAAYHNNSTAVGYGAQTTASNQIMLGTSTIDVYVNHILQVGGYTTNLSFTGTNNWQGDIAFSPRLNVSQANGNNSGVILSSNYVVDLSGATTRATNCGFVAERQGSSHRVWFDGCATNVIANQNGNESTAANRIVTGTGGDVMMTNQPAWADFQYRTNSSRWYLLGHSD